MTFTWQKFIDDLHIAYGSGSMVELYGYKSKSQMIANEPVVLPATLVLGYLGHEVKITIKEYT